MPHYRRRRRHVVTRGGLKLPKSGALFYSLLPNTEDVPWDEGALWDENMLWGGWILPVELYPFLGTPFWFSNSTTPVVRTGAEILAWPSINTTINGIKVSFSLTTGLEVSWHRIAYIPNAYPFTDKDGANTRPLKDLQYIQSPGAFELTHADITAGGTTIVNVPAGPTAVIAAPQAGKIVVGAGTLWSFIITFPDMTVSSYEFATALTATTGVCFDTSDYGRHLLFTVADTAAVCVSGREYGSDWLNQGGYTASDGSQYFDNSSFQKVIAPEIIIPIKHDGVSVCSQSWPLESLLGGEKVANSTMSSDANWTKIQIGSGPAPSWNRGGYILPRLGGNSGRLGQNIGAVNNAWYCIKLEGLTGTSSVQVRFCTVDFGTGSSSLFNFTSTKNVGIIQNVSGSATPCILLIPLNDGDSTVSYVSTKQIDVTTDEYLHDVDFIVLGDSIAAGQHTANPYKPPYFGDGLGPITSEIAYQMSKLAAYNFRYKNYALSSQTFAWVSETSVPGTPLAGVRSVASHAPPFVIIHCGTNDITSGRTWGDVATNLTTIRAALPASTKMFIDEILPRNSFSDAQAGTSRTWNTNLAAFCAEPSNNAILIRCHDAFAQVRASTGQLDDYIPAYTYGGTHLSQEGVNNMARIWLDAVESVYGNPFVDNPIADSSTPTTYPSRAKYNLTRISGTSATLADADTYKLPDSHECRQAMGWVYGTANWAYTDAGVPIEVTGAVIKAHNDSYAFDWSDTKGLAVYALANQTSTVALKADKAMKLLPYNQPTAFFNGVDFTDKTSFESGDSTHPGQWVLDNTGTLVNAGVDVPAVQGMRLEWVAGDELLTNPEMDTDTTWTKYTVGTGETPTWASGAYTIVRVDGNNNGRLRQNVTVTQGKKYRIVCTGLSASQSVQIRFADAALNNVSSGITFTSTVTSIDAVCDVIAPTQVVVLPVTVGGNVVSSVSLQELTPTWCDTAFDTTPIVASTSQPTRVSGMNGSDWTNVYTPGTTFNRYNTGNTRPNVQMDAPGFLSEPARTNEVLNSTAPVTQTTGSLATGIYCLWVEGSGSVQASAGTAAATGGWGSAAVAGTPVTFTVTTGGTVVLTKTGTVTFMQLEGGAFPTSRIVTAGAKITRAATVATFLTAGKIRSNDIAFRMIVLPRQPGVASTWPILFAMVQDTNNALYIVCAENLGFVAEKRVGGTTISPNTLGAITRDQAIELIIIQSSTLGISLTRRNYTGSTPGSWTNGTYVANATGKANLVVPTNYYVGSDTGNVNLVSNISLFETLPLPLGLTDPLAWAKAQWGIS